MSDLSKVVKVRQFGNKKNLPCPHITEIFINISLKRSPYYVDELITYCAKLLDIGPIKRHLFGIYCPEKNLWLAPNHDLKMPCDNLDLFEFRIRFIPFSIGSLRPKLSKDEFPTDCENDQNLKCFNYLYDQVRHDFFKIRYEKTLESRVFGCMVADMTRYIIEKGIPVEKSYNELNFTEFLPYKYRIKKGINFFKGKKIQESINICWRNSQNSSSYVKERYLESLIGHSNPDALLPTYQLERYNTDYEKYMNKRRLSSRVDVQFLPHHELGISFRFIENINKNDNKNWHTICTIEELCFVSVHNLTVEITRKSGIPTSLLFKDELELRSFVSLLDGYYRLTDKWAFSICKEISSPYLQKLKMLKCHGPVSPDFAFKKINNFEKKVTGLYLLRESCTESDAYYLDLVISQNSIETFKIKKIDGDKCQIETPEGHTETYKTLTDLIKNFVYESEEFKTKTKLENCLHPSEYDQPNNLLLCSSKTNKKRNKQKKESHLPVIVPLSKIELLGDVLKSDKDFIVRNVLINLRKQDGEKYILKQFLNGTLAGNYLDTIDKWLNIRSDVIVKFYGITCSPLGLILEYVPLGPLDVYLKTNRSKVNKVNLIQIATYAARALFFLDENKLVHGRIRCKQFLVSHLGSNNIKIKLSDPFGSIDIYNELAWLPPEFNLNGTTQITSLVDVWSFGTTLWEIFSFGDKPENLHVAQMVRPFTCDNGIWELINECRFYNWEFRKTPQAIMRDIYQIFYEIDNTQKFTTYTTIDLEDNEDFEENSLKRSLYTDKVFIEKFLKEARNSKNDKTNFLKSFIGSSRNSLNKPPIEVPVIEEKPNKENNDIFIPDSWAIDTNQLIFDKNLKILGEGHYGEVVKAGLNICGIIQNVAVKRMKNSVAFSSADMKSEISLMTTLQHANIVEIKGFVKDPQVMLVMEFVEHGSLLNYLKFNKEANNKRLPLIKFSVDICNGMHYLEYKKVIHRDLAARNILVVNPMHLKISDFDLARSLEDNEDFYRIRNKSRNLPIKWYAPESLKTFEFSNKSDIWSYGVTLWEIFSFGCDPSYKISPHPSLMISSLISLLDSGERLECSEDCPISVYKLMRECWIENPNDRHSFSSLQIQLANIKEELKAFNIE